MKSIDSIQREVHDMFLNVHSHNMINIKTTNNSITHFVDEDSNFEDRACYGNVLNKFIEEASLLNSLNEITAEGFNVHCMTIYGWRNMEPAIPDLNSDEKNASYHSVIEEVFSTEIEMIKALSDFQYRSVALFSSVIHGLKSSPQHSNAGKLLGLMKLLDLFLVLDVLKGCKISITNNFTFFCKLFGNDMEKANKWIPLRIFISSQDVFMQKVKEILSGTDLTDIFIQMLYFACDALENNQYLLPNSKYFYLRCLCAVMFVLENKNCSLVTLESKKKINLSRITKILKDVYVIPIIGDTVMKPKIFFQKLPSFNRYNLPPPDPVPKIMAVSLSHFIGNLEDDVDKMMIRLIKLQQSNKAVHVGLNFTRVLPEFVESHYQMLVEAVSLLSRITSVLNEVYSFKMNSTLKQEPGSNGHQPISSKIVSTDSTRDESGNIDLYLMRTQNNFSSRELKRFVKLISFNRMLYNELTKCRIYFDSVVRYYFHRQLQTIIQSSLTELAAKFEKSKKRSHYHQFLFSVACMCMDTNKFHVKVSNNDKKNQFSYPEKDVSPTSTQMYLMMRTIRFCLNEPEIQSKLDNKTRKSMEDFLRNCFFCEDMLKLSVTLDEASNLGFFWFREHFLDMCRPFRVQYPIENSFFWILLKQSTEPPYVDWIAHLLDLYNDSARWILHTIRRQFLYSELESELNVCFQTLVLELGMKIYNGFRMVCSNIHLDKAYRSVIRMNTIENPKLKSIDAVLNVASLFPYLPILRQRNLNILGRSVNLNYLFHDCFTDFLSESLIYAIKNLQEKGVSYIYELYSLYAVTKMTHQFISNEINLMPFEMIESISTGKFENSSLKGGLAGVVAEVLLNSLVRNYVYCVSTDRFTKKNVERPQVPEPTSSRYIHTFGSRCLNLAFADLIVNKSLYFGREHLYQILELIGYSGLADIISPIVKYINELITKDLIQVMEGCEFLHEAIDAIPLVSGFNHYVQMCYAHTNKMPMIILLKAMDILTRIGNSLVLILMIERVLILRESFSQLQSAPLLGILPTSSSEFDDKMRKETVSERHRLFPVQSQYILQELIPDEVATSLSLSESKLFLSEKLSTGMGFFQKSLIEIKNALVSVENQMEPSNVSKPNANKHQNTQVNSSLMKIVNKKHFFSQLWSMISFLFCVKGDTVSSKSRDQFGDASIFAAVTIITLLGQENGFRLKDMIIRSVKSCDFYSFSGQGSFIMDWMASRDSQNSRSIRSTISNTLFRSSTMMKSNSKEKDNRESEKLYHLFRRHSEIQDTAFYTIKKYIIAESPLGSIDRNIDCFIPPSFTPS